MIVHLSTVHPRNDVRILVKEVSSAKKNLADDVVLVVADGGGTEKLKLGDNLIDIYDIGKSRFGRIGRIFVTSFRAFWVVRNMHPRLIHFHDPELLLAGIIFKIFRYKVVYDIHEDVPKQILSKYWLPLFSRRFLSIFVSMIEYLGSRSFDGLVVATPSIGRRFPTTKTVCVQNYAIIDEMKVINAPAYLDRENRLTYIGVISEGRGLTEILKTLDELPSELSIRLSLAGYFSPDDYSDELTKMNGWNIVDYVGLANRDEVARLLSVAKIGLLLLHPLPNHLESQPVKLFEYMAAGLPVIASDFPLWRKIIGSEECGILVDPLNVDELVNAVVWLLEHPNEAKEMGERGKQAIIDKYSWDRESEKLISLYARILGPESIRN